MVHDDTMPWPFADYESIDHEGRYGIRWKIRRRNALKKIRPRISPRTDATRRAVHPPVLPSWFYIVRKIDPVKLRAMAPQIIRPCARVSFENYRCRSELARSQMRIDASLMKAK
jgi:hypothetical protein